MKLTNLDTVLWALSLAGQLALCLILIYRKLYRDFPIFTAYLLYSSASDLLFYLVFRHWSPIRYFQVYFANTVPEFLFQIAILLEVAYNVIKPVKRSLPKAALSVFAGMLVSGTLLALLLSIHANPANLNRWGQYFARVNFAVAVLRMIIFSAITLFSQMLGIGWKNHVLQIATGFASYSIVVLLMESLRRFAGIGNDHLYHMQDQLKVVSWCFALGYWSYMLAKNEAPRKEFSPRMSNFLVSIAQVAKSDRATAARLDRK